MHATSAQGLSPELHLGPIEQVSFAVSDLDASLPTYAALFGPFEIRRVTVNPDLVTYRGRPMVADLYIGVARSGNITIELVSVESGSHPVSDHLEVHGDGLHHIGFAVDDVKATTAALEDLGFETISEGTTSTGSLFCYVQAPTTMGHTLFELSGPGSHPAGSPTT